MPKGWNKGYTKENNVSVRKISETMKIRGIDNFYNWREKKRTEGLIPDTKTPFVKNQELAELIGVILGDGNIGVFPRTERLIISCDSNKPNFVKRYAALSEKILKKKPTLMKVYNKNNIRISIYQKNISKRLGIPSGNRGRVVTKVPNWILKDKQYIVGYLRGLYEAEGSFCVHKPTSTYKLSFSNRNDSMLDNVFNLMKKLDFHPHRSKYQIQLSRKKEVYEAIEVLSFRKY